MFKSLKIVFAGTSNFAMHHLDALISSGCNIVSVLTQPDRPAGRGKKLMSSPVKKLAEKKGIPVFQPFSLFSQENQKFVSNLNADIIVVVAYGLIFPQSIIGIPNFGCINVHASLLPRWRGAAPVQRSLLAGDTETGITIIKMNTRLDTGDILYKAFCSISSNDTSFSLHEKLAILGRKGLIEVLRKIVKGEIYAEKQDESLATYAEKLSKKEARINWFTSAIKLECCIRAFNPWPRSWIEINGKLIKIWKASVIKNSINEKPGTIIQANKQGIQVATIKDILNLELLQPSGRKPMTAKDLLNSRYEWFVPGKILD